MIDQPKTNDLSYEQFNTVYNEHYQWPKIMKKVSLGLQPGKMVRNC